MDINLKVSERAYEELYFLAQESGHGVSDEVLFQMNKGLQHERGEMVDHHTLMEFVARLASGTQLDA